MFSSQQVNKNVLTVSKLNRLARSILESEIGLIWLSAEISNFVAASSGHWYFTLKDSRAQVRAAMFKGSNRTVQQRPKEGDKVLVRAKLSLYEPRGDYQLIVEHLEPEGQGLLKQQFEQLKVRLSAEGLFSEQHKQPLPSSIQKVGVITSPTGAALHDILHVLKRRNPAIEVILYPAQVQGDDASRQLVGALELANQRQEVDVLIFGRGGGSLEDLWCFNEEAVARALFASKLPVVSAVGHEIDVSISDFVADLRAPTPSAAAEMVSRDQAEMLRQVEQAKTALVSAWRLQHQQANLALGQYYQRIQHNHPQYRLQQQSQQIDQCLTALSNTLLQRLGRENRALAELQQRFQHQAPLHRIKQLQQQSSQYQQRLRQAIGKTLQYKGQQLAENSHLLDAVSPLATLSRGYNIGFKRDEVVRSVAQLKAGDTLTSRFKDGEVTSTVTACHKSENGNL